MKARKKPLVTDFETYTDTQSIGCMPKDCEIQPIDSDSEWICKGCGKSSKEHSNVKTLKGFHIVCPGDVIIRGIKGEFYPLNQDIFEKTYDIIEEENIIV